jgi:hypothetical protein
VPTTQEIFDMLNLQPGDGRTRSGCVIGGSWVSVEFLIDTQCSGDMMESMTRSSIRAMENAAADVGRVVKLDTVRRYCAIAYAWVPGAGLDDDGHPRRELLPIRHSIHGAPKFGADRAQLDAEPTMLQIFWQAETE